MKMTIDSMNVFSMNVGEMVTTFSEVMRVAIDGGEVASFPAVMLWGAPGVGKSQGVRQLADSVARLTGKRAVVTDVRLILFNPVDLRGLPLASADKTMAVWLRPKIFCMDPSNDVLNFLFLDEISAAPLSVQAAAYQIALDKTVGEHKLPSNCFVIAAGNRTTDKSVAYKMPKALANRLCHVQIESNFDSFKNWAVKHDFDSRIIGFLTTSPAYLMDSIAENDNVAFPTPRAWEMVNKFLTLCRGDVDKAYPFIAGAVGQNVAAEFRAWAKTKYKLPDIDGIFAGTCNDVPEATNQLYAVTSAMLIKAKQAQHNSVQINNSLRYVVRLPRDYAYALIKDYMAISREVKDLVCNNDDVKRWIAANKRYLNA